MDNKDIGNRIHSLIKNNKLTARELSAKTGIPESAFSNYKKGAYAPSAEALFHISEFFGITIDWLLTGEGEMYRLPRSNESPPTEQIKVAGKIEPSSLPVDEMMLLDYYRQMDYDGKKDAHEALRAMLDSHKKEEAALSHSAYENEISDELFPDIKKIG